MAEDSGRPEPAADEASEAPVGRPRSRWRNLRRFVLWASTFLLLVGMQLLILVESDWFSERVRRELVELLESRLSSAVTIESLDLDLLPTSIEARGVEVVGALPGEATFARAERLNADLVVQWRWPLGLAVRRLEVDRPRIELRRGEEGGWSLPRWTRLEEVRTGGGRATIELGGLEVREGELVIDERRLPFELDVGALKADLVGLGGTRVRGEVGIDDVSISLPGAEPVPISLSGRLLIDTDRVVLERARLSGPNLESAVGVVVEWQDGPPRVRVEIDAQAQAELARRLGYFDSGLDGQLRILGQYKWRSRQGAAHEEDDADFDAWRFEGTIASERLEWGEFELVDANGTLIVEQDGLALRLDQGELSGGSLVGELDLAYGQDSRGGDDEVPEGRLALEVDGASIEPLLQVSTLPLRDLAGLVSGRFDYRFDRSDLLGGVGLADLRVEAALDVPGARPVRGVIPLMIDRGVLSTEAASFELPSQSLFLSGSWRLEQETGRASLELRTADLPALAELLDLPAVVAEDPWVRDPAGGGRMGPPRGEPRVGVLRGRGQIDAELDVRPGGAFVADVSARLNDLSVATEQAFVDAEAASGRFRWHGTGIPSLEVELEKEGGILRASGAIDWASAEEGLDPPERATIRTALSLEAADWPIEGMLRGVSGWGGRLNGRGRLDLLQTANESSNELEIQSRVRVADAVVSGTPIGSVEGELRVSGQRVEIYDGVIETDSGLISASGTVDFATEQVRAAVLADDLDLNRGLFENLGIDASASMRASVSGTLGAPRLEARIESKPNQGTSGEILESTLFTLSWDGEQLDAQGELAGLVAVSGGGRLDRSEIDLSFDVRNEDLGSLIEAVTRLAAEKSGLEDPDTEGLDDEITRLLSETEGRFEGRVELASAWSDLANRLELEDSVGRSLSVGVVIDTLVADLRGREIRNLEPVSLRLAGQTLHVDSLFLTGPDGLSELFVFGNVLFGESPPTLDLRLDGSLSGHWIEEVVPEVRAEGHVDFLGVVTGTTLDPEVSGQAGVDQGRVVINGLTHSFDRIDATVLFYPDRAVLDRIEADFADGRVRGSGRVVWPEGEVVPPAAPPRSRIELQARGEDLALREPEPWTLRGDLDLSYRQEADGRRVLVGRVDLDEALYLAEVDLGIAQLFRGLVQRSRVEVVERNEALDSVRLDLDVNGPGALGVRNNLADLEGDIDLLVQGTLARPIAFGRVELERGSTIDYGGDRYEISRGALTFADPYRIDPLIDLVATTKRRDFDIVLNLSGTREELEANLSSDPPLPQLEVFDLLASGTPLGGGGSSAVTASDLIYTQATSLVEGRVTNLFGLDRFRLDPLRSGDGLSSARVTLGKRISKDLFLTYSVDPSSTDDSVVEVEWRISDRVVLVFSQNTDGSYSVDARWEQSF